jgi:hypothetical protein
MRSQTANPVHIVVGGMLVLIGGVVLMQRAGLASWTADVSLWSVLLVGFGVAKLVESRAQSPRRGYIALLVGLWLLASDLGWIVLRDTWPLLVVALGVAMVVDVMLPAQSTATEVPGGHSGGSSTPLMVAGVVLAVILVARSGPVLPSVSQESSGDQVHLFSLMSKSTRTNASPQFRGGEITTLVAGSDLDLLQATPAPGDVIALDVRTVLGTTVLHLPEHWTLDVQTLSVAGRVVDRRFPAAAAAASPRVVLRGFVVMGTLVIRS